MTWFIFPILAAAGWAAVNVFDKFVISRWTSNFFVPAGLTSTVSILVAGGLVVVG